MPTIIVSSTWQSRARFDGKFHRMEFHERIGNAVADGLELPQNDVKVKDEPLGDAAVRVKELEIEFVANRGFAASHNHVHAIIAGVVADFYPLPAGEIIETEVGFTSRAIGQHGEIYRVGNGDYTSIGSWGEELFEQADRTRATKEVVSRSNRGPTQRDADEAEMHGPDFSEIDDLADAAAQDLAEMNDDERAIALHGLNS